MNPMRKALIGAAIVGSTLTGGALGAVLINGTAGAQSTSSGQSSTAADSSSSGGTATTATTATDQPSFPAHGTAEHEALEKPVTGDSATKAQEAAVTSLGGGTAGAVTTDASGTGFEVTVTKADGTTVEVHLDSSYTVMTGHHGHGGGMHDGDGDGAAAASTATTQA